MECCPTQNKPDLPGSMSWGPEAHRALDDWREWEGKLRLVKKLDTGDASEMSTGIKEWRTSILLESPHKPGLTEEGGFELA